jgi:hypothetical protein
MSNRSPADAAKQRPSTGLRGGHLECRSLKRMSDRELRRKVSVWGELYEVTVYPQAESWVAVGDYMGETITVHDRSDGAAVKGWSEAVRNRSLNNAKR